MSPSSQGKIPPLTAASSPLFMKAASMLVKGTGPTPSKMMFIGEAPGQEEEWAGKPFVGASGQEFDRMAIEAGLIPPRVKVSDVYYTTNVFEERPADNKIEQFCTTLAVARSEYASALPRLREEWPTYPFPDRYTFASVGKDMYVEPRRLGVLPRLREEIERAQPNLIVSLGNTATWAVLGSGGITRIRGTVNLSAFANGRKVLPTFHPANVLRQWKNRWLVVLDLMKAAKEAEFSFLRRPEREIWIEPTIQDLDWFYESRIKGMGRGHALGTDVETSGGHITCIGFAPSPRSAIVVPFLDKRKPDWNYWPTHREECYAMRWCRKILTDRTIPKVFHNGLYDMQYIWWDWKCPTFGADHDTMIEFHSLLPEMKKDLGTLGSIYSNEAPWKLMRHRKKDEHAEKKND